MISVANFLPLFRKQQSDDEAGAEALGSDIVRTIRPIAHTTTHADALAAQVDELGDEGVDGSRRVRCSAACWATTSESPRIRLEPPAMLWLVGVEYRTSGRIPNRLHPLLAIARTGTGTSI